MAATGILDFQNGETLAVGRLKTAKMRHHARFNLSVKPALRYSHILLFKTAAAAIKMVAAAVLDFQNVVILGWDKSRWPKCVTLPNFAAICRTVAEIWPFFQFFKMAAKTQYPLKYDGVPQPTNRSQPLVGQVHHSRTSGNMMGCHNPLIDLSR